VYSASDVRQIKINTAEPLVRDTSPFEVESAIAKLKDYKSPGSDQILAELIKQEAKHYYVRSINSLILFGIRKTCLITGRTLITVRVCKKGYKTDFSSYCGISLLSTSFKIVLNILSRLGAYVDEIIGDHQCRF
jgi:hypothetical protein